MQENKTLVPFSTYSFRSGVSKPELRAWVGSGASATAFPAGQGLATQAVTPGNAPCLLRHWRAPWHLPFHPVPFLTADALSLLILLIVSFGGRKAWMCCLPWRAFLFSLSVSMISYWSQVPKLSSSRFFLKLSLNYVLLGIEFLCVQCQPCWSADEYLRSPLCRPLFSVLRIPWRPRQSPRRQECSQKPTSRWILTWRINFVQEGATFSPNTYLSNGWALWKHVFHVIAYFQVIISMFPCYAL